MCVCFTPEHLHKRVHTHTRKNVTLLYALCWCVFVVHTVKSEIFKLSCLGGRVVCESNHTYTHKLLENVCALKKASTDTRKVFFFSSIFCTNLSSVFLLLQIPSADCQPMYLPRLPSSSFLFPLFLLSLLLPPLSSSPHRATVGQTSLVVSSVDFLEPLRGAGELASIIISVKYIEP